MWGRCDSEFGACSLQWDDRGRVEKLYFTDNVDFDGDRDDRLAAVIGAKIFSGQRVELSLHGSELEMAVWAELQNIPRGKTSTYQQIAYSVGYSHAVRAVASAIGRNEVSYCIPCHRVMRKDGSLGGYRWGVEIKQRLLDKEKVIR